MIRFLRRVLKDIKQGENIDLIIAIPLAIIIAILSGLGFATTAIVQSTILATLGLIVIGFLSTRYKLDDLYVKSEARNTVLFLFEKPSTLKEMMKSSDEIWMTGLTLRTTTTENYHLLEKRAIEGARIRTLIVDQDKLDMNKVVKRFAHGKYEEISKTESFRADFKQTVRDYESIRKSARRPGNVKLGFLDFVPSYSLYIFPKTKNEGVVFVELYGYQSDLGSIPRFQLTEYGNPEWYKFFRGQFERMWQDSTPAPINGNVVA